MVVRSAMRGGRRAGVRTIGFDLIWYTTLAVLASRAKAGFMASRAGRRLERGTGAVLIALGLRVALD